MTRRFPPPWQVEQIPGGFRVLDASGQALVYIYARESRDEADIAKVPFRQRSAARGSSTSLGCAYGAAFLIASWKRLRASWNRLLAVSSRLGLDIERILFAFDILAGLTRDKVPASGFRKIVRATVGALGLTIRSAASPSPPLGSVGSVL